MPDYLCWSISYKTHWTLRANSKLRFGLIAAKVEAARAHAHFSDEVMKWRQRRRYNSLQKGFIFKKASILLSFVEPAASKSFNTTPFNPLAGLRGTRPWIAWLRHGIAAWLSY